MWFQQSPNFTVGRGGKKIEFIVVHWIVGDVSAADAVFRNAAYQTSAHYAVQTGTVHQYVKEGDTAWHAGNFDINQRSIGIEHRGGPNLPIDAGTYEQSAQLIADICRRYGKRFPLRKHSEFKATQCPGTLDLNRINRRVDELLNQGVSMPATAQDIENIYQRNLGRSGNGDSGAASRVGKPYKTMNEEVYNSSEAKAYRAAVAARLAAAEALKAQVAELSTRPTKEQLQQALDVANAAQAKADQAEAKLEAERAKATEDTKTLDQGAAAAQGFWAFLQSLLNRGK